MEGQYKKNFHQFILGPSIVFILAGNPLSNPQTHSQSDLQSNSQSIYSQYDNPTVQFVPGDTGPAVVVQPTPPSPQDFNPTVVVPANPTPTVVMPATPTPDVVVRPSPSTPAVVVNPDATPTVVVPAQSNPTVVVQPETAPAKVKVETSPTSSNSTVIVKPETVPNPPKTEVEVKPGTTTTTTTTSIVIQPVAQQEMSGKKVEIEDFVRKAADYAKKNGREASFEEFNKKNGQFTEGTSYVFALDYTGKMLANGSDRDSIGKNQFDLQDLDGKYINRDLIAKAKAGGGWEQYRWTNPVTHALECKKTYVLPMEGYLIGSGYYYLPNADGKCD